MTAFDILDALLLAGVILAWMQARNAYLAWAVGGLIMTHLSGRHIMATYEDPLPLLGVGFTGVAIAYLLAPIITVYGRVIGTLFAGMGMACFVSLMTGHNPPIGQGLAFNVWNMLSTMLHLSAIILIVGVHRHGRILDRANRARR